MSDVKRWVLTVCVIAVVAAIFELLIPDKKYERLLRPIIAAFAIYTIIAPVKGMIASCSDAAAVYPGAEVSEELRETVERQAVDIVRSAAASEIKRAVAGIAPDGCEVEVFAEAVGDGSVAITGALLTVPATCRPWERGLRERAAEVIGLDAEKIQVVYE